MLLIVAIKIKIEAAERSICSAQPSNRGKMLFSNLATRSEKYPNQPNTLGDSLRHFNQCFTCEVGVDLHL